MEKQECYLVVLSDEKLKPDIVALSYKADIMKILKKIIQTEICEFVHPEKLDCSRFLMLVDENSKLFDPPRGYVNVLASYLYGTEKHCDPIIGKAVIVKLIPEDFDYLTFEEAVEICEMLHPMIDTAYAHMTELFRTAKPTS